MLRLRIVVALCTCIIGACVPLPVSEVQQKEQTSPASPAPPPPHLNRPEPKVMLAETPAARVLRLVREASLRCEEVSFTVEMFLREGNRLLARPVALCAYDEERDVWHEVLVRATHFAKEDWARSPEWREEHFTLTPLTLGDYVVERTKGSGFGVNRLSVDLAFQGRHLTVYRIKQVWFEKEYYESGRADTMLAHMHTVDLTPDHPDFHGKGLDDVALEWLLSEVDDMRRTMDRNGVRSAAFSGRAITEVIPSVLLLAIPVIEHIDQEQYMGRGVCPAEPKQNPCIDRAHRETIEGALIVYALNERNANRWSISGSGAVAAWQFMNTKATPTYDAVVRACPDANLTPDFFDGARDFQNAGRAAMCLLDLNLSYLPEIQDVYERNPVLGGIYLLAAYNGGPRWARELFKKVHEKHPDVERERIVLPETLALSRTVTSTKVVSPRGSSRVRRVTYSKLVPRLNGETPGYADKFLVFLDYLSEHGIAVSP